MIFPPELVAAVTGAVAFVVGLAFKLVLERFGIDLTENQAALVTVLANIVLALFAGVLSYFPGNLQPILITLIVLVLAAFFTKKEQAKAMRIRAELKFLKTLAAKRK